MRGNHFLLFAIICMLAGGGIALGQCVPPPSGMVAWWPGDNSTTDIVNGNNGTLMSGATYTAGNVLQAFDFSNGTGYLNVPSSSTLNFGTGDFSIDAWVNLPAGQATRLIVDKRVSTPVGYNFYIWNGLPGVQLGDGSSTNYNANSADHPSIDDNTWHHVAVTVQRSDSNGIRFYVDGLQLATTRDPRAHQGSLTNTASLRLGLNVFGAQPLSGLADEVELFSRVLTPAEILSIFQAGSFGKCKAGGPPNEEHYKTWRTEPQPIFEIVKVQDQFMEDSLHLIGIEFLSNPVEKVHQLDTFNILNPNNHLTWYRAMGKDTLLTVGYINQFESATVSIDSVRYLLVPTQKMPHAPPEGLDHYKAYQIKNPVPFKDIFTLKDQFDSIYGQVENIDSLIPRYFLTPAVKNMQPPMFDSVTHYVAYEIFPKRFFPRTVNTIDQFGPHEMQVLNSEFLLVPSAKFIPPDTSGSICGSKFNDLDCDGVWDAGEPGLAGWTINLAGTMIGSVITGVGGTYCFSGLTPGNYTVSEVLPPGGWTQTKPPPPGTYAVPLLSGQTVIGIDFGNCLPPPPSDTGRNHYKTWRIAPLQFNTFVRVQDQFMTDSLRLVEIAFLSNPVEKIHQLDTFNILKPNDHLTWYRAEGKDTLLTVGYINQFESTAVSIDSVKYLLVPTQKLPHAEPESLDHYKAYRIKNPMTLHNLITLEDQFDTLGHPVSIDSLKPTYFLTPALKNMPPPMFDSVTHYVAYEIFPKRFSPRQVNTSDQFGPHILQVLNSEFLLVPSTKSIPPDTSGSICGHKFNDLDCDGTWDVGEPGMAGWTINLTGTAIKSTVTGADGSYCFNGLSPGNYTVSEVIPPGGWTQTLPLPPGTYIINLSSGETVTGKDFGNGICPPVQSDTSRNHYKTWRIAPLQFDSVVIVQDQFMTDSLRLVEIAFLSNPVEKIHQSDTFNIIKPYDYLTWYRALGKDTLLTIKYVNQFEDTTVSIDSVKYLLVPTQKLPHAPPDSLDHYKAYRIKNPKTLHNPITLDDEFDVIYGQPEYIDSLIPRYFLTPALKNIPPPMFDSVTHYVAYEIFPKRVYPLSDTTHDQFNEHFLQVLNSEFLLVPSTKSIPPTPSTGTAYNKDFQNNTGQTVNNIEIILEGDQYIYDHYDNNGGGTHGYTDGIFRFSSTVTTMGGNIVTVLKWDNVNVPPGGIVHIGFWTHNTSVTIKSMYWTKDSICIGPITQVTLNPTWIVSTGVIIKNNVTGCPPLAVAVPLNADIFGVEYYEKAQPLGTLNNYTNRTPIRRDTAGFVPITLPADASDTVYCVDPPEDANYMVWIIDIDTDPGMASPALMREFVQFPIGRTLDGTVNGGWDMISVPLYADDMRKTILFPTATSDAFSYVGYYEAQDTVWPFIGYWLKFSSSQTITMSGYELTSGEVTVTSGWNMIGTLSIPIPVSLITSEPPGLVTSDFFGFNGSYHQEDTIMPFKGYWIKSSGPGTLILSATQSAEAIAKNAIRIVSTIELPPPPPDVSIAMERTIPKEYRLDQAYPNPFNPVTTIRYELPVDSRVSLKVYDILGQVVAILKEGTEQAGYKSVEWNAGIVSSGIYFYKLEAVNVSDVTKSYTQVKKVLLLK